MIDDKYCALVARALDQAVEMISECTNIQMEISSFIFNNPKPKREQVAQIYALANGMKHKVQEVLAITINIINFNMAKITNMSNQDSDLSDKKLLLSINLILIKNQERLEKLESDLFKTIDDLYFGKIVMAGLNSQACATSYRECTSCFQQLKDYINYDLQRQCND